MLTLRVGNVKVEFDHDGGRAFKKAGTIDWPGKPVRVLGDPYHFNFDLEGRIQRIDGFPSPHSWDWLQRTMVDDWIYYDKAWVQGHLPQPSSIIGDSVWAVNGRTDLPMLHGHKGLQSEYAAQALEAFDALIASIRDWMEQKPDVYAEPGRESASTRDVNRLWEFLAKAAKGDRGQLQEVADRLQDVHGHMAVLPPDTIRVDYRVLLLKVMDGCTNACGFCMARGESPFALRSTNDIDGQIEGLREIYGADLYNYNSVVLGECDALLSPVVEYAARRAFDAFRCGSSHHDGSNLFLFATNNTLCTEPDSTIEMLESLPFEKVYVNIGWEAATDASLSRLGKRQSAQEVHLGMEKAGKINRRHGKVRISGNFVTADGFECDDIVRVIGRTRYCGQLYLSPLHGRCCSGKALEDLHAIRDAAPDVVVYLYTMQRM